MTLVTNDQLRCSILEILYKSVQEDVKSLGLERAKMIDLLKVSKKRVDLTQTKELARSQVEKLVKKRT
jgi:hypothetical protein